MRVLLTSEARFERTPDARIWGPQACGGALWSRYLDVFSTILVAARIVDVQEPSPGSIHVSLPEVQFLPLPPYSGPAGFVQNTARIYSCVSAAVRQSPALIVRTPSAVAYLMCRAASRAERPFGAEVVGDPYDVFSPGGFQHPLRSPIRWLGTAAQKRLSRRAVAVLYVTSEALQRRYPTHGRSFAVSDVALDDLAFSEEKPRDWRPPAPFVLVTTSALDQPYKGTAVLLEAIGELRRRGASVKLRIVGSGRLLTQLQCQAETLDISAEVEFLGQQDLTGVRQALDSAHLFVLPSLQEGLPRALLEAMARGLPAVATNVGGVPELLAPECLVPARDPRVLAERIEGLMLDGVARDRQAELNRRAARKYHERALSAARREFLHHVRDACAGAPREARCA